MFVGAIFLSVVMILLILILATYFLATKRIKLSLIILTFIIILPIFGIVLLNIRKQITEQDIKSVSLKIPKYKNTVVTNTYNKTPIFGLLSDSYQQEGITLSIKASENVSQVDLINFYDTWFKEDGWTKIVTDISSGQHHYIKGNTSAHLWLRDFNLWTIEITKR